MEIDYMENNFKILTKEEQELKTLLIKLAIRVPLFIDNQKGLIFYDKLCDYICVNESTLYNMLDHISLHDFYYEDHAPMLESILNDLGTLHKRPGFYELLGKFYEISNFNRQKEYSKIEESRVYWYYGVNHEYKDRFNKFLKQEHIIVSQNRLMQWCNEDLSSIALRLFSPYLKMPITVRYILLDDKPFFRTANYGDFFFKGGRMYVITRDASLSKFHDWEIANWLFEKADNHVSKEYYTKDKYEDFDYFSEDGDLVEYGPFYPSFYSRLKFKDHKLFVIPALFAGVKTNLIDNNSQTTLFTGDVITIEEPDYFHSMSAALDVFNENQYAMILDNHSLLLPTNNSSKYYKQGTSFYFLDENQTELNVRNCCNSYAQSWDDPKLLYRKIKTSPCFNAEDWKWSGLDILGIEIGDAPESKHTVSNLGTIQELLAGHDADFDKSTKIKLVRHKDNRPSKERIINGMTYDGDLKDLYYNNPQLFMMYCCEQKQETFAGVDYIVTFLGEEGTTARFIGVFQIIGQKAGLHNEEVKLQLKQLDAFYPFEDRVIIEWGKGTVKWHQNYSNQKVILRIE